MVLRNEELVKEITSSLESLQNTRTESIRQLRREYSKRIKDETPESVFQLALTLLKTPTVPEFLAFELVQQHVCANALNASMLTRLGAGLDRWDTVDAFACYLSGPAWHNHQVPDSLIVRWAKDPNRWVRRTAVVSTVPLNNRARGGRGDTVRTLQICRLVISDRDDMVVKALSWALRELAKRDSRSVADFLKAEKNNLAPRVVREVTNKLKTGLKNPQQKRVLV